MSKEGKEGIGGFLAGIGEGLGLIEVEGGATAEPSVSSAAAGTPLAAAPITSVAAASSDPKMVKMIWDAVTDSAHAPLLSGFLPHLEKGRKLFAADPTNATRVALEFSGIDKAQLLAEMDRSVAATVAQAEQKVSQETARIRTEAENGFQAEEERLNGSIQGDNEEIRKLQARVAQNQTALQTLAQKRGATQATHAEQERIGIGSLEEVKRELAALKQNLSATA